MIKLNDFLERGYSVKYTNIHPQRRCLCEEDADYKRVQEMAASLGGGYKDIEEALAKESPRKYILESTLFHGDKFQKACVLLDDEDAELSVMAKGKSELAVTYSVTTGKVYEVRDTARYFDSGFSYSIKCDAESEISEVMSRIKEHRDEKRKKIISYYNALLRDTKGDYRRMLSAIKGQIADL